MHIAIYARKSTESEDRQIQSLEDQISALRQLAAREGFPEPEIFEESRSAMIPDNRPEFGRLMKAVDEGRITVLLTWSLNRLSRNSKESGIIGQYLHDGAIEFIQTPERVYRPDDNALLFAVESGMAIAYGQDLKRNVVRGMKGKVERGWTCSKAPVGYLNDIESRAIVIDKDRFSLVRIGWDMLLTGEYSVNHIHRELVRLGLTVSSRKGRLRPISRARLHTMFRERFYMGEILFKGQVFPGKHPAMITRSEFDRAQILVKRQFAPKIQPLERFAFGGTLNCSVCGCRIVGERRIKNYPKSNRTATYIYYHCSGYRGCSKRAVREEVLIDAVLSELVNLRMDHDTADWLKEALLESTEKDVAIQSQSASDLQAQQRKLGDRLKNLTILRLDNEVSPAEYQEIRSELTERLNSLAEKIRSIQDFTTTHLKALYDRLDLSVMAGELLGTDNDITALGQILRTAGIHNLNLENPKFELDPVLQKITTFEPLRNGSERPKHGGSLPLNSVWWSLVDDLRTCFTSETSTARSSIKDSQLRRMGSQCSEVQTTNSP